MDGVWKTLAAPIIVAIIGGYGLAKLQTPDTPSLHATVTWIDLPNPIKSTDSKTRQEFSRAGQAALGSNNFDTLLEWSRFRETVRLAVVKIENNSQLRSKDFEVYIPDRDGVILADTSSAATTARPRVVLKPLDPGATISISVFSQPWSGYLPMPIGLLHDGKKVQVAVHTAEGSSATIVDWIATYPILSMVVGTMMAMGALLLLILLPIGIAMERSPELRLRLSTNSDLAKLARFVDWVRKSHPSRLGSNAGESVTPSKPAETSAAE